MHRLISSALTLVPLAGAARVQVDHGNLISTDDGTSEGHESKSQSRDARSLISEDEWLTSGHGAGHGEGFACPWFCSECCKDYRSLTGFVRDYLVDRSQFKCTFPHHEAHLLENATFKDQAMHGRECTDAAADPDDPHVYEVLCRFSEEERGAQAWRELGDCHLDASVISYDAWLGPDSCSYTRFGRMLSRVSGQEWFGFVDLGIRAVVSHNPFVVCRAKAAQFRGINAVLDNSTTEDEISAEACPQLSIDIDHHRMDPFNMAFWAMGTGELARVDTYPKPVDEARILQKHTIPGWPARTVAYESMPEDPKPISLYDGAVQCMMRRLRREHLHDDVISLDSGINSYGRTEEDPRGPRWPTDIQQAYFENYMQYQPRGNHFDVPADQLLSDATLDKLVFQSIGAHHLEIIPADGSSAVDLNFLSLGGCAGVPAGNGCPNPLDQVLASLPDQTRQQARYAVRMEGLYDDVPVREGLARWGSNAFFDEAGRILAIQHKGETKFPSSRAGWDYFKYVFRGSLIGTVTAVDHLAGCHILMAETLALSTYETLGPKDSLRLLLAPHTYGSLQINSVAAMTLFAGNMQVHRATPFGLDAFEPEDGSTGAIWAKSIVLRVQTFEDIYAGYSANRNSVARAPEIPFFEDGYLLYSALKRYVSAFIDEAFGSRAMCDRNLRHDAPTQRFVNKFFAETDPATPDLWPEEMRNAGESCESLKALLTESIFCVSGIHRHVGSVSDFFRDMTFASTAWPEGELQPRPKQGFLTLLLAAATNFFGPKMDGGSNLTHIFEDKPGAQRVFERFVQELAEVQTEVEVRNERRLAEGELAFHQMEPKYVEWGIMI